MFWSDLLRLMDPKFHIWYVLFWNFTCGIHHWTNWYDTVLFEYAKKTSQLKCFYEVVCALTCDYACYKRRCRWFFLGFLMCLFIALTCGERMTIKIWTFDNLTTAPSHKSDSNQAQYVRKIPRHLHQEAITSEACWMLHLINDRNIDFRIHSIVHIK